MPNETVKDNPFHLIVPNTNNFQIDEVKEDLLIESPLQVLKDEFGIEVYNGRRVLLIDGLYPIDLTEMVLFTNDVSKGVITFRNPTTRAEFKYQCESPKAMRRLIISILRVRMGDPCK